MCKKKRDLRCPVCHKSINNASGLRGLDVTEERRLLLPQPGDLTECCHCEAMLEYGGDMISLSLHPAPKKRIDSFNALTREGPHEPSFHELIAYIMKYRQMPVQFPIGYRFRKTGRTLGLASRIGLPKTRDLN